MKRRKIEPSTVASVCVQADLARQEIRVLAARWLAVRRKMTRTPEESWTPFLGELRYLESQLGEDIRTVHKREADGLVK